MDDDAELIEVLRKGLMKRGYRVFPYTNPSVVLRDFSPNFYDMAILDVRMWPYGGFELRRKLEGLDPGLHVCFLTAYADSIVDKPKDIAFLQKPVSFEDLVAQIEKIDGRAN